MIYSKGSKSVLSGSLQRFFRCGPAMLGRSLKKQRRQKRVNKNKNKTENQQTKTRSKREANRNSFLLTCKNRGSATAPNTIKNFPSNVGLHCGAQPFVCGIHWISAMDWANSLQNVKKISRKASEVIEPSTENQPKPKKTNGFQRESSKQVQK